MSIVSCSIHRVSQKKTENSLLPLRPCIWHKDKPFKNGNKVDWFFMQLEYIQNMKEIERRVPEKMDVKLSVHFDRSPNFSGVCILGAALKTSR